MSDAKVRVVSNSILINDVVDYNPDKIIISPGPGHPKYETGNVIPILQSLGNHIPIFGVCLGNQAIAEAFGEDQSVEYVGTAVHVVQARKNFTNIS